MTYFARTPRLLKRTMKSALWQVPTKDKVVYLTFDDGPTSKVTPQVLDILDDYNAKSTFFCIGRNVVKHPGIFADILQRGHEVGNHTFSHISGWETNVENYEADVLKCAGHVPGKMFRPPYGRIGPGQYQLLLKNFHIVMWSVLSWDFDPWITPQKCADNIIQNTFPGAIVVFHDSSKAAKNCLFSLSASLDALSEAGYCFEALKIADS